MDLRICIVFLFSVLEHLPKLQSQPFDYPTANLSTSWTNAPNIPHTITYPDGSVIKALLLRQNPKMIGPSFACGFYCKDSAGGSCGSFLFGVFIVYVNSGARITLPQDGIPHVVWSANRDRPVKENATLELKKDGDLVLKDVDGTHIWSTNTSAKSVAGMNMTEAGNLVLFSAEKLLVWQSFDHPTDTLLEGQKLMGGQRLTSNTSALNATEGEYYLSVTSGGWATYVASNPPQKYYSSGSTVTSNSTNSLSSVTYMNGSLVFSENPSTIGEPSSSSEQYLRLESDGHLRVYSWRNMGRSGWDRVKELINFYTGDCSYPLVCGRYGVCRNGQCTCPSNGTESYFRYVNNESPSLGCSPLVPLSCQSPQNHKLLTLNDVAYFSYSYGRDVASKLNTIESCKETCLRNCTCRAALFQYGLNTSDGTCFLVSEVLSLFNNDRTLTHFNSTAYLKVEVPQPELSSGSKGTNVGRVVGVVIGVVFGVLVIALIFAFFKKTSGSEKEEDDDEFDQFPSTTMRFSHEQLKVATQDFSCELGKGGFGSVFEGKLVDGTRVAVKRLDSVGQGKKEFLSEVETVGSIHHLNLVRLVGFCAEKSHRLLVYEYMSNGSLDQWIFGKNKTQVLDWKTKCKIINHVAKGLLYLHEECRQKIIHLDIKPQNILVDENFDAKVSDFGLSKLMDRDQSCVMTMMRGTLGYLAPEWLSAVITEKVDVYSFGVVIVEIVCGRMNIDNSKSEKSRHLLGLLKEKSEEAQILDFIRSYNKDGQLDETEAEKMLRLAMWCLQSDPSRRASMVEVVKALEDDLEVDIDLNYDFFTSVHGHDRPKSIDSRDFAPLLASISSNPTSTTSGSIYSDLSVR